MIIIAVLAFIVFAVEFAGHIIISLTTQSKRAEHIWCAAYAFIIGILLLTDQASTFVWKIMIEKGETLAMARGTTQAMDLVGIAALLIGVVFALIAFFKQYNPTPATSKASKGSFCSKCGTPRNGTDPFCSGCGHSYSNDQDVAP